MHDKTKTHSRQKPKRAESGTRNYLLQVDPLRRSSVKIGTIQRRLAWPLRKDDTQKSRMVSNLDLRSSRCRVQTLEVHYHITSRSHISSFGKSSDTQVGKGFKFIFILLYGVLSFQLVRYLTTGS